MALTATNIAQLNKMNMAAKNAALGTLLASLEDGSLPGTTAGTVEASKAVVVSSTKKVNEWGVEQTVTSATPATTRLTQSEITLTPATTFAVGSGGSIAGVRGGVTVSAGKSFTSGFLYGTQGKATLAGTIAETDAARITGVLGQTDLASGTVTAGQVSGVWADLQGAPTLTVPDQVFPLRVTNSMSVDAYAMEYFHGKATYFASINEPSVSFVSAVTPAAATGSIKVLINGDVRYLLYTDDPTA